jgi:hypothetical protein
MASRFTVWALKRWCDLSCMAASRWVSALV